MRTTTVWAVVALMAISTTALGQEDRERPADEDRPEREGQRQRGPRDGDRPGPRDGDRPGSRDFRPFGSPLLMIALDIDRNGELSAEEIEQAVAALKKLDKNEDGVIDREELRPQPPFGDRGPRGGRPDEADRPRPEGDRPPREGDRFGRESDRGPREEGDRGPRPEGDRGPRPDGDRGAGDRGGRGRGFGGPGGPEGGAERFVDRLMQSDEDGDGKLSRAELLKAVENMRPGGGRGGRGGREGGSGRPPRPE